MLRITLTCAIGATLLAGSASAQFNNQWVEFQLKQDLGTSVYANGDEVDFAWGDVDNDGDIDLVAVVKEDFTSTGKRRNKLLMNEGGTLVDRTTQFATDADVGGDNGFNTPTNDRDVVVWDLDNDGWMEIVTATTISDGDPKHIGHPRVYKNKGGTTWLGFRFENGRIPQLLHFGTGLPENPRFCSVAAGDVTGDNFADLYFGDYDSSGAGGSQQPGNKDLNDRLLINDGNGFFSDQSQSRMTSTMLLSAFGMAVAIEDFNLDGANDILKDTALNPPQYVAISYNNPNNKGFFNLFNNFHTFAPYHTSTGDMNNDGRVDIVVSDDNQDRYRYNLSNDAFGQAVWGTAKTYSFLTGGDDGFASNNLIADLNNDGWKDSLHCDVDVDIGGYNRRLHIYHNRGGAPGSQPTLVEERQSSSSGWIGAVGFTTNDLRGMHDVAAFDIDGDGDNDLVLGQGNTLTRVRVYENRTIVGPPVTCEPDAAINTQNNANLDLSVCSQGGLATGVTGTLTASGLTPNAQFILFGGFSLLGLPVPELKDPNGVPGILGPNPSLVFVLPVAPLSGEISINFPGGGGPFTFHAQVFSQSAVLGTTWWASNTVSMSFLP